MSGRRRFVLLMCTAIGALTILAPSPQRGLAPIESAAPPYGMTLAELDPTDEPAMAALRQQANLALAQLQTRIDSAH
jgi:hypothetical protein